MSSNIPRQYLESGDLTIIDNVLKEAGFDGADPHGDATSKADAARFLIRAFQKGEHSRERLMLALKARNEGEPGNTQPHALARMTAGERWDDDGGQ